jgi:hypothetical protein
VRKVIFGGAAFASVEYGGLIDSGTSKAVPPSRLRTIKLSQELRDFTVSQDRRVTKVSPQRKEFPQ